jgi:predicted RNA-binding protein with TRAM domain
MTTDSGSSSTPPPEAPSNVYATAGHGSVEVTFVGSGNAVDAGVSSYTATADDVTTAGNGGQNTSGTASPITIAGLHAGDVYTVTVVAVGATDDSPPSNPSNEVTIPYSVPDPPTDVVASAGDSSLTVSFLAPDYDGGHPITGYTAVTVDAIVTANGGQSVSGPSSPLTLTGLTNGDGYTVTITATNSAGDSQSSQTSNLVIPTAAPVQEDTPPYENALTFTITFPVDLDQLIDEVSNACGQTVMISFVHDASLDELSPDDPGTMYLIPDTVDASVVQGVLDSYDFNPSYGRTQVVADYAAVVAAVQDNNEVVLSAEQIQAALRGLILGLDATPTDPNPDEGDDATFTVR